MNTSSGHAMPLHPTTALREQTVRIEAAQATRQLAAQHGAGPAVLGPIDGYIRLLGQQAQTLKTAAAALLADED